MLLLSKTIVSRSTSLMSLLPHSRKTLVPVLTDTTARYFGSVKKKEKKSKGSSGGAVAGENARPRDLEVILSALDAPATKPPPADEEELARRERIRKAYTVGKFEQHNEENHDLTCKLKMKQHALKMLPRNSKLKEKALQIDGAGPPRWRRIPAWTPPIPGFDPNKFTLTED